MSVLPDVLAPGLSVVFCGTGVGRRSAASQAYYADPRNRFWRMLHETGLTPRLLAPDEYPSLPQYRIGLTDLAKASVGTDAELGAGAYDVAAFNRRVLSYQPKVVAFNGKTAAKIGLDFADVDYGEQAIRIGQSRVFVLPSTSGAAVRAWQPKYWHALAQVLQELR